MNCINKLHQQSLTLGCRKKTSGKYDRPSVTADIVALRLAYDEDTNWRENPVFALEALFVKRGKRLFKDCWTLPGGFIRKGESN